MLCVSLCSTYNSANLIPEIESFLQSRSQERFPDAHISVQVLPLDPRLKLAPCDQYQFSLRSQKPIGRVSIGVRCSLPKPWAIYLPAQVQATKDVVVVRAGVERGSILSLTNLAVEPRDLSKIRSNFLTRVSDAQGFESVRRLSSGSVLYSNLIKQPLVVKRGERVNIQAGHGAITISAIGEALQDGAFGQQIKIRNLQSKKVVHAWVRSKGLVSTRFLSEISNLR